ncbi:MAG: hypothetical protein IJ471_05670 [Eubacterium sp.]|nr:hypothetical protein [Eubacterium sp.]
MKIGIPRALLYHRYDVLWTTYFRELGFEVIVSPVTNKTILEDGDRYSIDENCLSSKLFFGHVSALIGKCDYIFVPRIANYGNEGVLCSRFEALYDIAVNTFRDKGTEFITCDVDVQQKKPELVAFSNLALQFGKTYSEGARAYEAAKQAAQEAQQKKIEAQEALLAQDGIKILVVGHSYNLHDTYIGKPIVSALQKLDAIPLLADAVNLDAVRTRYTNICKDVPWMVNRELVGAIDQYHDDVDGIILITAFPCGPDSMLNEMIIRRVKDKPILNLLLDSQDGNAGIETRLESFVDIIRFRKGAQV